MLYHKYSEQAYTLAFKYLCNKSMAEDAVQNLFLKIWIKREQIDAGAPFNYYLFTILKNDLLNILRDTKSEVFKLEDCLEVLNKIDDTTEKETQEIIKEQSAILRKAIDSLSPQKKTIFELKATGEYSNEQIANKLNLSINTVKFQYTQSLKKLRELVRTISIILLFLN
ncbi:MAG: sigma-70 family RNA polymerase sigma factor [Muribaculaceae bacterium]|nr:sigma-70 family RNA polymerase sigma factor [Muribaculaceae bacterium]